MEILNERPGVSKELLFNLVVGEVGKKYGIVELSDYKITFNNLRGELEEKNISTSNFFNDYPPKGVYLKEKN